MKFDPQKHRRRSIRLKGYDYCVGGFVPPHTLCRWHEASGAASWRVFCDHCCLAA